MSNMRVCAEINLPAMVKNIEAVRNIVGDSVKIMAVIKADGYGHGAVECAEAIKKIADSYAVATIEEALELRESGVDKKILILGYIFPDRFEEAIMNDITLTVFNFETAECISETAEKLNKKAVIHIAVDTGMGRIGFIPNEESVSQIVKISKLPCVEMEGIFSHFATSDEKDKAYAYGQLEKFRSFQEMLKNKGVDIKIKHIDNSAGITELDDSHFNMVRMGIILYGLYPSNEVDKSKIKLYPVMKFKSSVVNVKTIKKGECISYGCHFKAEKDTKVATVSVGYADGYPRLLSSKGRVIVNGKYAPVIGNVCMDQMMIDVSGIEDVKVGTEVVLFGNQGDVEIKADEIAALTGTINYEIVCGVSKRVRRVYIK